MEYLWPLITCISDNTRVMILVVAMASTIVKNGINVQSFVSEQTKMLRMRFFLLEK